MPRRWRFARRGALLALGLMLAMALAGPMFAATADHDDKQNIPAVRWDEQIPGCTFSRGEDGQLHYGLWSGDLGIVLSVDFQELEKVHRRHEPFLAAMLALHYRGQQPLEFTTDNISLEFVKHFPVVETPLDPDAFAEKVQSDADEVDHQAAREAQKHPEQKEAKELYARAFQKDTAELLEFISKNSLRPTRLTPGNPETHGWLLFGAESQRIGGWKKQEEFILRVPLEGKVFEFPFALPPRPGEMMLRRRE